MPNKAYCPVRRKPGETMPHFKGDASYSVFAGISIWHNADAPMARVINYGDQPCRVMGPVNPGEMIGLSPSDTADYLITSPTIPSCMALDKIETATVKVIWVRIGGGSGGGTTDARWC